MISTNDFLTPKGSRPSKSNPFPNTPIISIDAFEAGKRLGFTVNRAAGEILNLNKEEGSNTKFTGDQYLAFVAKNDSLYVTVIDEETAKANRGNFCRVGKSGTGNSKDAWNEATSVPSINGGENLIVNTTETDDVYELTVYLGDGEEVSNEAAAESNETEVATTSEDEPAADQAEVETTDDFSGF